MTKRTWGPLPATFAVQEDLVDTTRLYMLTYYEIAFISKDKFYHIYILDW